MSLRAPLARVRGLGSAKSGTEHWWQQRLTAVLLAPLCLWFVFSMCSMDYGSHAAVAAWMRQPLSAVLLVLLLLSMFHHAQLGVQVVIEDYIEPEWQKIACIILVKFLALVGALVSVFAVVRVFAGF